jgi:hypothetical protein
VKPDYQTIDERARRTKRKEHDHEYESISGLPHEQ